MKERRAYRYSYGDVGRLRGVGAESARRWFLRRGEKLSRDTPVRNLVNVIRYARGLLLPDEKSPGTESDDKAQ